jgi:hypothetical protein
MPKTYSQDTRCPSYVEQKHHGRRYLPAQAATARVAGKGQYRQRHTAAQAALRDGNRFSSSKSAGQVASKPIEVTKITGNRVRLVPIRRSSKTLASTFRPVSTTTRFGHDHCGNRLGPTKALFDALALASHSRPCRIRGASSFVILVKDCACDSGSAMFRPAHHLDNKL